MTGFLPTKTVLSPCCVSNLSGLRGRQSYLSLLSGGATASSAHEAQGEGRHGGYMECPHSCLYALTRGAWEVLSHPKSGLPMRPTTALRH